MTTFAVVIREGQGFRLQRISQDGAERHDLDREGMFGTIRFAEKAGLVFSKESEDGVPHVWRVDPATTSNCTIACATVPSLDNIRTSNSHGVRRRGRRADTLLRFREAEC